MKKVIYLLACVAFLGCYSCSADTIPSPVVAWFKLMM